MADISCLRIYTHELSVPISKTDNSQKRRSVRHQHVNYCNILSASARNSVKPGLITTKASDSSGCNSACRNQRFEAHTGDILALVCGSINLNFKKGLANCL